MRQQLKKVICVDLDGSVSNDDARRHLAPPAGTPLDGWAAFHEACPYDPPIMGVVTVLRALQATHQIHYVSGRFASNHTATEAWLDRHNIPFDAVRLYTMNDRPARNEEHKLRYIQHLRDMRLQPVLFIEDLPYVADYIETHARIPVLCVNPRYKVSAKQLQPA